MVVIVNDDIDAQRIRQAISVNEGDLTKIENSSRFLKAQWISSCLKGIIIHGIRTLEEVKTRVKLTRQQTIGLRYYEEFLQRMPRTEATAIVNTVLNVAGQILGLVCVACGSYRRGKETCGDIDILLTHPDGKSHQGTLNSLVKTLTDMGFLTDHLVESHEDGDQKKYMGVCILPGESRIHRRIDIISVPYSEYASSLIYFTGSEHFTRSIYAKAKSMGMRLNHHGLRGGVMRQGGEKLNDGI